MKLKHVVLIEIVNQCKLLLCHGTVYIS